MSSSGVAASIRGVKEAPAQSELSHPQLTASPPGEHFTNQWPTGCSWSLQPEQEFVGFGLVWAIPSPKGSMIACPALIPRSVMGVCQQYCYCCYWCCWKSKGFCRSPFQPRGRNHPSHLPQTPGVDPELYSKHTCLSQLPPNNHHTARASLLGAPNWERQMFNLSWSFRAGKFLPGISFEYFHVITLLQITFDYSCAGNFCHNCCNLAGFSFFPIKVINDDAFKINFHSSSSWQPLCLCYSGQSKNIKKGISWVLSSVLTHKET